MSRATAPAPDPRRQQLLEAALGVFARYGFKKTSMDEVARAAGLSRQGLYLHFATKEALFRAAVEALLATSLDEARAALADAPAPLAARLARACDAWMGRFIGAFGGDAADLVEATGALVGAQVTRAERDFADALAGAMRKAGLAAAYPGLRARELAASLLTTARGLKYTAATRAAFVESVTLATRVLCAPLGRR